MRIYRIEFLLPAASYLDIYDVNWFIIKSEFYVGILYREKRGLRDVCIK